jgi:hypothetical protein
MTQEMCKGFETETLFLWNSSDNEHNWMSYSLPPTTPHSPPPKERETVRENDTEDIMD